MTHSRRYEIVSRQDELSEPAFTPEEYERFRNDWYETVAPKLREHDHARAESERRARCPRVC